MGFLKKIFGQEEPKSSSKIFTKRAPRIRFQDKVAQFRTDTLQLEIANISVSGFALNKKSFPVLPGIGQTLVGIVVIHGEEISVSARVIHASGQIIGCQFLNPTTTLESLLHRHFQLELSALQLVHINSQLLKHREDGTPHYFQGKERAELFYVINQGQLLELNATFGGHYIEKSSKSVLRYGKVKIFTSETIEGFKKEDPIEWIPQVPNHIPKLFKNFLFNIEGLDPLHRQSILDFF